MSRVAASRCAGAAALFLAAGCASPRTELERVAKDWCMTIRASQVLPVYPLTEDVQPGDVFVVQVPLSEQPELYDAQGFLALDQLAVRLGELGSAYDAFYGSAYWTGTYAEVPHARPGWPAATPGEPPAPVQAARVAFPTYGFRVDASKGLKLALPLSGVPVGLGLMDARRAQGTVTLDDAYTYAVDIETLLRRLHAWWDGDSGVRSVLASVAADADSEVYLRVVNRVYLTSKVSVALTNLSSTTGGVDAAAASVPALLDFSELDPGEVEAAGEAYQQALQALSGNLASATPGGSFRFTQASQRSVAMEQTFDRPLVVGYLGFDVRVDPESGELSPPIPSFAVLEDRVEAFPKAVPYVAEPLSDAYLRWLPMGDHFAEVAAWLQEQGIDANPADLANNAEQRDVLWRLARLHGGFEVRETLGEEPGGGADDGR